MIFSMFAQMKLNLKDDPFIHNCPRLIILLSYSKNCKSSAVPIYAA